MNNSSQGREQHHTLWAYTGIMQLHNQIFSWYPTTYNPHRAWNYIYWYSKHGTRWPLLYCNMHVLWKSLMRHSRTTVYVQVRCHPQQNMQNSLSLNHVDIHSYTRSFTLPSTTLLPLTTYWQPQVHHRVVSALVRTWSMHTLRSSESEQRYYHWPRAFLSRMLDLQSRCETNLSNRMGATITSSYSKVTVIVDVYPG